MLDVKPTVWFASPFDAAMADVNGVVNFTSPGKITVGAVFGEQIGFADVIVADDPIARVDIPELKGALAVGGTIALGPTSLHSRWRAAYRCRDQLEIALVGRRENRRRRSGNRRRAGHGENRGDLGQSDEKDSIKVVADSVKHFAIDPETTSARTGDVVHFQVTAHDAGGKVIKDLAARWSVSG